MEHRADGTLRILLIEDRPEDVHLVTRCLRSDRRLHSIESVDRVSRSLPLLDEGCVDLILLDLGLPDSTGLESFHRLRAHAPDIPIIILTGESDEQGASEAVRSGAQDYLIKEELVGNLLLHAVRYAAQRHAFHKELEDLSLRDPLTALYNRRGFSILAEQSLRLAKRNGRESVLLLADVDALKSINDTHGHLAGDRALCVVARALTGAMRDSDIIARFAGDEFVALAVEAHPPGIPSLVARLRDHLREECLSAEDMQGLSVSIGVAPFDPKGAPTLEELIERADREMYREKQGGRRVEAARLEGAQDTAEESGA